MSQDKLKNFQNMFFRNAFGRYTVSFFRPNRALFFVAAKPAVKKGAGDTRFLANLTYRFALKNNPFNKF
jgi:hypothetical protein